MSVGGPRMFLLVPLATSEIYEERISKLCHARADGHRSGTVKRWQRTDRETGQTFVDRVGQDATRVCRELADAMIIVQFGNSLDDVNYSHSFD